MSMLDAVTLALFTPTRLGSAQCPTRARPTDAPSDAEILRCIHCGVRARWADGVLVSAEPHMIPAYCGPRRPLRAHGPFIPDNERSTT